MLWTAQGRVGARGASLVARQLGPDLVRVDCANNKCWVVVDLDTRTAHGSVAGVALADHFAVRDTPAGGLRVDHPLCRWFWLELSTGSASAGSALAG